MKFLSLFTLIAIFSLSACNPFSLEAPNGRRDRGGQDEAQGQKEFKPNLQEIGEKIEEIKQAPKKIKSNCKDYKQGPGGIWSNTELGKIQNCIAKGIDENMEPLCEQERVVKDALDYYERKDDEEGIREAEALLDEIEEQKDTIGEEFFTIADHFDLIEEELIDYVKKDQDPSVFESLIQAFGSLGIKTSVGGFTRLFDSRGRVTCRGYDLSAAAKKNNRR